MATSDDETEPGDPEPGIPGRRDIVDPTCRPWMAPSDAHGTERYTENQAALLNRLESVGRTRRVITADVSVERGNHSPVAPQNKHGSIAWQQKSADQNVFDCRRESEPGERNRGHASTEPFLRDAVNSSHSTLYG
jgi:hypothetical protein